MRVSRRNFVKSASALGVLSAASITLPEEAKAVELTTVMAVTNAAFSIYKMSQSGGGGIASLLSAQIQMLRAISEQVIVINGKLDLVYSKLGDIEEAIGRLPQAVSDAIFRRQVLGAILRASQILELAQGHESKRGRTYAIQQVGEEAKEILERLADPLSSIVVERNPANLPVLTMAWFMELQLRARAIPYDRERIRKAAQNYLVEANILLPPIETRLEKVSQQAVAAYRLLTLEDVYSAYGCYDQIVDEARLIAGPGTGGYQYKQQGRLNKLAKSPAGAQAEPDPYLQGFAELAIAGIELPSELAAAPPKWQVSRENKVFVNRYQGAGSPYPADVVRARKILSQQSCEGPLGHPDNFKTTHESREKDFSRIQLDALVNGNLLLVGRELKRSAEGILARMTPA